MKNNPLPYRRKVNYYETDRMNIVHHSNYIRYFEEARLDYLSQTVFDYAAIENEGYISPVLSASCKYKSMAHFGDMLLIETFLTSVANVRYTFSYKVTNEKTGELVAEGETSHCFIDKDGKIVSLKRIHPTLFNTMQEYVTEI